MASAPLYAASCEGGDAYGLDLTTSPCKVWEAPDVRVRGLATRLASGLPLRRKGGLILMPNRAKPLAPSRWEELSKYRARTPDQWPKQLEASKDDARPPTKDSKRKGQT